MIAASFVYFSIFKGIKYEICRNPHDVNSYDVSDRDVITTEISADFTPARSSNWALSEAEPQSDIVTSKL